MGVLEDNNFKNSATRARECGRKGGIAAGIASRKRKTLKENLLLLLSDKSVQDDVCVALLKRAKQGDTRAFEVIRDSIGEKPVDVTVTGNVSIMPAIEINDKELEFEIGNKAEVVKE